MESKPNIIGYVGTGISVIGVIGAILFFPDKAAVAGIPLAVGVGCNMFSRDQLSSTLVESHNENQKAIANVTSLLEKNQEALKDSIQINQANLSEQIKILQGDLSRNLDTTKTELNDKIETLKNDEQKLSGIVGNLTNIEQASQELRLNPNSSEFFYQRGVSQENLGNKHGAIEDYTEAIKRQSNLAPAYHKRGVVHLDLGNKQQAVDDLRKAALLYFEKGDIDGYQQARQMSRNIHELRNNIDGNSSEIMAATELLQN